MVKKIFPFLLITIISNFTQARWLKPEEADVSIEKKITQINVFPDGTIDSESSVQLKILNDAGRKFGTLRFNYSPKISQLVFENGEVRNGETVLKLKSSNIVDMPVRVNEMGFDELREVMVSVPQVQVGSILSYHLKEHIHHPVIENQYSHKFYIGDSFFEKDSEYSLTSKRPLFFSINDPTDAIELTKNEKGDVYKYTVKTKKPVFHRIFEEPKSRTNDELFTWVVVSTSPSYQDMYKPLALKYEKILSLPAPEKYKSLLDEVKVEKTDTEKIAQLLNRLSEKMRYMGDWRHRDGGIIPRSLTEITETQSGDCKDLSILTTKLLRELGFNAWVALVNRGSFVPQYTDFPNTSSFNHAIVFARLGNKKLWLDPTNFQSYPEGVFEDIAGRKALILDPEKIDFQEIEFTEPSLNINSTLGTLSFPQKEVLREKYVEKLSGWKAVSLTGSFLKISKDQFDQKTINNYASRSNLLNYKIQTPNLNSRIVKPVELQIELEENIHTTMTSTGSALNLSPPELVYDLKNMDMVDREFDIVLGVPGISDTKYYYENLRMVGSALKNCQVQSPWLDYSFSIKKKPLQVSRRLEIKKYVISYHDFKKEEFKKFKRQLSECGQRRYLVYEKIK